MMHSYESLPRGLWAELIYCVAYIPKNTGPSSEAQCELWIETWPRINQIRIIECLLVTHIETEEEEDAEENTERNTVCTAE